MKILKASSDAQGWTDGVTTSQLMDHLPNCVESYQEADVVLVMAVCHPGFKFNHQLNDIKKPWVLLDFTEWGWNWDFSKNNILGQSDCYPCTQPSNHEWGTLGQFINANPPVMTFQRDLKKSDVALNRRPIDFMAHLPIPETQSKGEFESRRFGVFNAFGYSHPTRARVHGQIFEAMGNKGVEVVDDYTKGDFGFSTPPNRLWMSVYSPHWWRKPMKDVMQWQQKAKIALALPGAGAKCFKDTESATGAIPAFVSNQLAYSYPWTQANSVQMDEGTEVDDLINALDSAPLYDIYRAAQENVRKYRIDNYLRDYFLPYIADRL
jgi:hypothetical protein